MKTRIKSCIATALFGVVFTLQVYGQATVFSYTGRRADNGSLASGTMASASPVAHLDPGGDRPAVQATSPHHSLFPSSSTTTHKAVAWSEIGAKAGTEYCGAGLSISPAESGALLRCVFQKLQGEAAADGLWLTSTAPGTANDRFRVLAATVGRASSTVTSTLECPTSNTQLAATGKPEIGGSTVRFIRPDLLEEYSVSMDGVRQDFVVTGKPQGSGELRVELEVTGARVEPAHYGARLVLENSGRKIAYSRLHVVDATGRELPARIEVVGATSHWPVPSGDPPGAMAAALDCRPASPSSSPVTPVPLDESPSGTGGSPVAPFDPCRTSALAVLVNDADAVYPVRIDPTFSDENWISMGAVPGADRTVSAAAVDDSGNLYIGGNFTVVGDVVANFIAKWDGSSWSALGSGMNSFVHSLAVSGSDLYVGGSFTTAGGIAANFIAKWDGSTWSALASGMNGDVLALAVSGSDLYAGGTFTAAGGVAANRIAKWDGSSWSALGSGMNGDVLALAVSGSDLYAGGTFTTAGGIVANRIAKWDGNSWSALGSGMDSEVRALAVSDSDLYAGGTFTMAGGVTVNHIAKWDGSSWSALGSGMMIGNVRALAVSGSDLYAGGFFNRASGVVANFIAKWDGSSWSALGSGMNSDVLALAVSGSDLYAGGEFSTAGGNVAIRIAKWDGSSWSALGEGTSGVVLALAVSGSDLYAAGEFTTVGGIVANRIAKWDGSSWSALGSGMDSTVRKLAVSGSDLYAAGTFRTAGGNAANEIAKWDGSSWSPLGSGVFGVFALAVSGSDLYAGGNFTTAGGIAANRIAKWDGSSWSALGSGMGGDFPPTVHTLAVSGSDLYAGGNFTTAGGIAANRIAKWDGSSWSALGSGLSGINSFVFALAVSGSDLYAGGEFTTAGGIAANFIAKWDGSSWSALGSGMNRLVGALAVSGSDLYAGGQFTTAGGIAANFIAKWDGSSWSPLGSGMGGLGWEVGGGGFPSVAALAVSGSDLYVGGFFTTAGGKVSASLAKATFGSVEPINAIILAPASGFLEQVNTPILFTGSFTEGGSGSGYQASWTFESATVPSTPVSGTVAGTSVADAIQFAAPGVYRFTLTVTDDAGNSGSADTINNDLPAYVVIYDPEGGFVTGGGWIMSPPGAFHPGVIEFSNLQGKASFGFVSRYQKGAGVPTGNTEFQFQAGNLNFKSSLYQWLVVAGARAQFKGRGSINGQGEYAFMLTAIDGQVRGAKGYDRFRIKIWDEASGALLYDNQADTDDNAELGDSTIIRGGSIVIHSP